MRKAVVRPDREFPGSYVGAEDQRFFTGFVENEGAALIRDVNHAVKQYDAKGSSIGPNQKFVPRMPMGPTKVVTLRYN